MGTIKVLPGTVTPGGAWTLSGGASSLRDVCAALSIGAAATATAVGTYSLTCLPGSTILIDGFVRNINQLPVGFTISSLLVNYIGIIGEGTSPFAVLDLIYNGVIIWTRVTENGNVNLGEVISSLPSNLGLFGNSWILNVTFGVTNDQTVEIKGGLYLTGIYTSTSFSFTIPSSAKAGDKITVTGAASNPVSLAQIGALSLQYIDGSGNVQTHIVYAQDFISQNALQIQFYLPQFGNFTGTASLFAYTNGYPSTGSESGFLLAPSPNNIVPAAGLTGSILLGTLTITFADASGIYTLIPGKGTDTVYNNARDGTTIEKNIPDPYIKTGFIP